MAVTVDESCSFPGNFCGADTYHCPKVECSRTYECFNRKDEDFSFCSHNPSNQTLERIGKLKEEYNGAIWDVVIALLFFILGAPFVIWMRHLLVKLLNSKSVFRTQDNLDTEKSLKKHEMGQLKHGLRKSTTNTDELVEFVLDIIKHVRTEECDNNLEFSKFGDQSWKNWRDIHITPQKSGSCNRRLLTDYKKIHDDVLWEVSVKTIFSMGAMFFENDENEGALIDKFNKTLHILEKLIHAGDNIEDNIGITGMDRETEVDLCLKTHYGNQVVSQMLWSSEPPCIRTNIYAHIRLPEVINRLFYSTFLAKITRYIGLFGESISYYIDLVKDVSILILFCNVTYQYWDSFSTFAEYLAATLVLTIVIPETLKTMYYYANQKFFFSKKDLLFSEEKLDLTNNSLNPIGKSMIAGFMFLFSPLLSNILFWERFKLNKEIFDRKRGLLVHIRSEIEKRDPTNKLTPFKPLKICGITLIKEPDTKCPKCNHEEIPLEELRNELAEYNQLVIRRDNYFRIMTTSAHLEGCTETFYQYVTHLIIIIISHMSVVSLSRDILDSTEQKDNLHRVFYDYPTGKFLLYYSIAKAFISLISTRVGIESHWKHWNFGDMAKILFGFHTLISLFVKIFSVVMFFVPTLGLFGFSTHKWMAKLQFSAASGINATRNETWNNITMEFQNQYYYDLDQHFAFYILFIIPFISIILYILKNYLLVHSFGGGGRKMIPRRLMHIACCVIFPSITQDWDNDYSNVTFSGEMLRDRISKSSKSLKKYHKEYRMRWYFQTKFELVFMVIWHAVVNVLHCIPLVLSGSKIIRYSTKLEENGFDQTRSEFDALATVKILMMFAPIFVGFLVPLIQWGTLMLYYYYGHPWCRIFNKFDFTKPDEPKSKQNMIEPATYKE